MAMTKKPAPRSRSAPAKKPAPKPRPATKKSAAKKKESGSGSDDALRALPAEYGDAPDMPVGVAIVELGSLHRLARTVAAKLARVGLGRAEVEELGRLVARLKGLEAGWQRARLAVKLGGGERKAQAEAEQLKSKLLAGGRWALRRDEDAQAELGRIAEGSGLGDTIQDLHDLAAFWGQYGDSLAHTDITARDLARAAELAASLEGAAAKETSSVEAAEALDLRNRCFWAADDLAREVREAGRYAFRTEPKIAAKFVSRYRSAVKRRSRSKAKNNGSSKPPAPSSGG